MGRKRLGIYSTFPLLRTWRETAVCQQPTNTTRMSLSYVQNLKGKAKEWVSQTHRGLAERERELRGLCTERWPTALGNANYTAERGKSKRRSLLQGKRRSRDWRAKYQEPNYLYYSKCAQTICTYLYLFPKAREGKVLDSRGFDSGQRQKLKVEGFRFLTMQVKTMSIVLTSKIGCP